MFPWVRSGLVGVEPLGDLHGAWQSVNTLLPLPLENRCEEDSKLEAAGYSLPVTPRAPGLVALDALGIAAWQARPRALSLWGSVWEVLLCSSVFHAFPFVGRNGADRAAS